MNDNEKATFRAWLKKNTSLSDKVIGDTASRLGRVDKIKPIQIKTGVEDFIFQLGKEPSFHSLSPAVKSQLKRACRLYYDYKNDC